MLITSTVEICIQQLGREEEMDFAARRSYASAVLGVVILSVCLSVRLSVCHTRASSKILGLETLERRRLNNDLVLYYKIQNGQCDTILNVAPGFSVTRGNNNNLLNKRAALMLENILLQQNCRRMEQFT